MITVLVFLAWWRSLDHDTNKSTYITFVLFFAFLYCLIPA